MDLLRQESPPAPSDTVMWFVFLLDPSLLEKHLNNPDADPSSTELITKFLTNGISNNDGGLKNKKNLAAKILALKVAAYLKWDLSILQSRLPLGMQRLLLNDLLYMVSQVEPDTSAHSALDFNDITPQVLFAVILYHRWVLRALVKQSASITSGLSGNGAGNVRTPMGSLPNGVPQNDSAAEELQRALEKQAAESVSVLQRALASHPAAVSVPTFDTFLPLTEDSNDLEMDWDKCQPISLHEFQCQLNFDLGVYFIFRQEHNLAREHFSACAEHYREISGNLLYCTVQQSQLNGYQLACGVIAPPQASLLCQFHASIKQQYMGIVNILIQDNKFKEIPMVHREHLELDIQGAVQSGKFTVARDLLLHVQCLNKARRLSSDQLICQDYTTRIRAAGIKGADLVISVLKPILLEAGQNNNAVKTKVKAYLSELLEAGNMTPLVRAVQSCHELYSLYEPLEFNKICGKTSDVSVPQMLTSNSWDLPDLGPRRNPRLEVGALEQQLIQSYDAKEIHQLLSKLISLPTVKSSVKEIWNINSKWELPIPVHSVIMSLPQGFLQYFCYILLAKAHELASVQEYFAAKKLFNVVECELKEASSQNIPSLYKLIRLCAWECLVVEINQFIDEWPAHNSRGEEIAEACRACLSARQAGEALIPRLEVIERCVVMLLNLQPSAVAGSHLDFLTKLDRHCGHVELAAAFAYACQDIMRHKACRHVSRDAWDLVLPVFLNGASKRNSSGILLHHTHRDSPVSSGGISSSVLWAFLAQLRDPTMITLAISLMARIHNVLRDDSKLDINVEYVSLWPGSISVPNSYSSRSVSELLYQLLGHALRYNPSHVGWLKVLGDLNFVMGHHATALKAYLEAAIAATDFFSQQLPKTQIDDLVIRRMIRCCSALQCHTQAAVLCQFLEEIDYTTAFKSLGETKSGSCADAMDSYYGCVWDTTLLEFLVQLHTKRGETHRKQLAIQTIGLLELNSNNNEEIQREAANVRKARFLRALAHQYVC